MHVKLTDFIISDLHIGHKNILEYCRSEFKSLDGMHETIIERWNAVVTKTDHVVVLGDLTVGSFKHVIPVLECLNGTKDLIMGNHDNEGVDVYMDWFGHIDAIGQAWSKKATRWSNGKHDGERIVLTHIPIHPQCMDRWVYNVHGHLHTNYIQNHNDWPQVGESVPDARYINVSCEVLNYTPTRLQDLIGGNCGQ